MVSQLTTKICSVDDWDNIKFYAVKYLLGAYENDDVMAMDKIWGGMSPEKLQLICVVNIKVFITYLKGS